jgi:hypothetical protein
LSLLKKEYLQAGIEFDQIADTVEDEFSAEKKSFLETRRPMKIPTKKLKSDGPLDGDNSNSEVGSRAQIVVSCNSAAPPLLYSLRYDKQYDTFSDSGG